jgi:mono/diheme cytochrome c family protein
VSPANRGVTFVEGPGQAAGSERAYVSHLVGSALTRIENFAGIPTAQSIALPAAPLRAPRVGAAAALGYALVASAEGDRLFASRHALGAVGKNAWFGAATVDALLLPSEQPLAPVRPLEAIATRSSLAQQLISGGDTQVPGSSLTPFVQPRALLLRESTHTLLVAGEGNDRIVELDALAVDPTMAVLHVYQVGSGYHPDFHVAAHCAAPSGMALSEDEQRLFVFCRATHDVLEVQLLPAAGALRVQSEPLARVELGADPLGPFGATGRKLFYGATDRNVSGGLACAGCHPDGRDDGFVWHEATFTTEDGQTTNFVGSPDNIPPEAHVNGFARRTPLLAGRVSAEGPYGWHAESPTLLDRELKGFGLHRWGAAPEHDAKLSDLAARALADFLRRGLVPPPAPDSSLDALESEGRRLFSSEQTHCAECHLPGTGYSAWHAYRLPPQAPPHGFDVEPDAAYKIPSLRHLNGRAPYFHDGSAPSLEALLEANHDRMGTTENLSMDGRRALLAFLKTL